jgi:hypothetical protein
MLTDDSAGEQCAVRKAFRGLEMGEQEVTHLLCKVHSQRTLRKKLAGDTCKRSREHLLAALYNRRTRKGCEDSVQAAIDAAPKTHRTYIEKEWWATMADWAHYPRSHSPLLLQVPSTNIVESWHASLKLRQKSAMSQWSLLGIIRHIANIAKDWDARAEKEAHSFRSTHLSETVFAPAMRKLPLPMQRMILEERRECQNLLNEGEEPGELKGDVPGCDCAFFRKWQLPCRHLWMAEELFGSVLTDDRWDTYAFWFEDCGFEFYEEQSYEFVESEDYEAIGAPARRRIEVSFSS